jgi:hypothetical protein
MSKSAVFLVCIAIGFGVLQPLAAGAQDAPLSDELAVVNVENAFLQARVTGDLSKIRTSFASDGVFITESGDERTRSALEAEVARGSYWLAVDRSQGIIKLIRNSAVTHAVLSIKLGGGQIDTVRTTGVYVKRAGSWRIVSWQSTPLLKIDGLHSKP